MINSRGESDFIFTAYFFALEFSWTVALVLEGNGEAETELLDG